MNQEPSSSGDDLRSEKYDIHPVVFFVSASLIFLFVILSLIFLDQLSELVNVVQGFIADKVGWFYVLTMNVILAFVIYLLFSRFGDIKLGGADAKPEFGLWAWFAMLFSAGMGIGLLFYSVAEPMYHFASPPQGPGGTVEAARSAMSITFFHWGLHVWGVYALVGLALAFFCFNRGLPLTVRSAFYPILGDRIYGPLGHAIDITAVVATLFGVATSLGLGVQQINAGLHYLFEIGQGRIVQVMLIGGITFIATGSVVLGLDKGIRRLSEFNMWIGLVLLVLVLIFGPTLFILDSLVENLGLYLQRLPELSLWTEAYTQTSWQNGWTIFYWGWWIAWSPFVGMFIARISKGRTVREFLLYVLLVPTALAFIWLTVFGNSAIFVELYGAGGIARAVRENMPLALFTLLEHFPLKTFTSLLATVVIITFFVTSSDSGSMVIDIITSGGNPDPPVKQRIFWAALEGVVASVLLLGGGLKALQTASIITGLPFAVILLFLCGSLYKGLKQDASKAPETD